MRVHKGEINCGREGFFCCCCVCWFWELFNADRCLLEGTQLPKQSMRFCNNLVLLSFSISTLVLSFQFCSCYSCMHFIDLLFGYYFYYIFYSIFFRLYVILVAIFIVYFILFFLKLYAYLRFCVFVNFFVFFLFFSLIFLSRFIFKFI